ncbi:DMT family transporter [Ideonella livida]|uniref:DMT family transporter n=1 Tax=Ideonella livida TaxID=2707176 RepID=A0A7C9TJY7_9BURK|nr:DMT family transporter [Ideonella livida]NDY90945.1 DMT family transporter [Ideonella livida]
MKTPDLAEMLLLAALWGASFLFMRVAAPHFGPLALMEVRVLIAAGLLLVWLALRGELAALWRHKGLLLLLGTINSALPFVLLGYATLSLTAGLAAILNATVPLWGALVAWAWLGDRPSRWRLLGLGLGFAGVLALVWGRVALQPGGAGLAVVAALTATLSYGVAASYTKRHASQVAPLVLATGSQLGAALVLAPLALWRWPAQAVPAQAWVSAAALGVLCTALAYVLFFRLVARLGPARSITVTYLIPAFAVLWGAVFLHEPLTLHMALGAAVILAGVTLSTGLWPRPPRQA